MTLGPSQPPTPSCMSQIDVACLEVIALLHYNKHDEVIRVCVS